MIEPFDQQRHDALLANAPIRAAGIDTTTTHMDVVAFGLVSPGLTLCDPAHLQVHAAQVTTDWRLVNCPACRACQEFRLREGVAL